MTTRDEYIEKFMQKVLINKDTGCWEWQRAKLRGGYGNLRVDGKYWQAHRYSYQLFFGIPVDGFDVCHKCDNPSCVNPKHLFLGNDLSNARDKVNKNRQTKGEQHPHHKMTLSDVVYMRAIYSYGTTSMRKLAKLFGISYSETNAILNNKTWKGV